MINLIETEQNFLALRPRWDLLVSRNKCARVFQTFSWCYAAWVYYHRVINPKARLYIVDVIRADGAEELILPFWIDERQTLRILGEQISDVCDAVYATESLTLHGMYVEAIRHIASIPGIKAVRLSHLLADSDMLGYFSVYYPYASVRYSDAYSYLHVEGSNDWRTAFTHLSSNGRKHIRRLLQEYGQCEFKILKIQNGEAFPENQIRELRRTMCEYGWRYPTFFTDAMLEVVREVYNAGFCEITVYISGEQRLEAASFRLLLHQHVNFWIVLYRNRDMPTALTARYIERKMSSGDWMFDFGTGVYPYKLNTFKPRVAHLFTIVSAPPSVMNLLRNLFEIIRVYVRQRAVEIGLAPILRRLGIMH